MVGCPHRPVTASLGIAHYPIHSINAGELLELADKALYAAKSAGRNRVKVACK
ncbi:diguanylate cyclase domain-containing protein [Desulforamulus putei]|uniref:diguanylate cyclase domain-containing protein n=1 Tax=Desulforamulus putei TaxID=74701 RepID=UPI000A02E195|nr:diguanylate cyclase [Desulforamulus putei]